MTPSTETKITFCGQPLSAEELALIQGIAKDFSNLGRTEIANTACELLQMVRPTDN